MVGDSGLTTDQLNYNYKLVHLMVHHLLNWQNKVEKDEWILRIVATV